MEVCGLWSRLKMRDAKFEKWPEHFAKFAGCLVFTLCKIKRARIRRISLLLFLLFYIAIIFYLTFPQILWCQFLH